MLYPILKRKNRYFSGAKSSFWLRRLRGRNCDDLRAYGRRLRSVRNSSPLGGIRNRNTQMAKFLKFDRQRYWG
jgi:hypothetical protein